MKKKQIKDKFVSFAVTEDLQKKIRKIPRYTVWIREVVVRELERTGK